MPMEDSRHSHRRKHSHSQRQTTKRTVSAVASDSKLPSGSAPPGIVPVFGDLIETDSELKKFAQRVLGPYGQYQSAMKKMDTSEQMYGIAEPSSASAKSREVSSKTNQLAFPADHKRDRDKKKKQRTTTKLERHENPLCTGTVKAKVSVRPYKASQLTTSVDVSSSEIHLPHVENDSKEKLPGVPPQQALAPIPSTAPSQRKRQKKQRRSNSHAEDPVSECVAQSIPLKPRPEALSIETSSTPIQSDGPDTGDVRHMLNELLHPPPVSLVTPILTPNKLQPFTFPTAHHVFKAPNSSDAYFSRNTSSSAAQHQASTHTQPSQRTHKNVLSSGSDSIENVLRSASIMERRHSSSSSASSSLSSSSDSDNDASSTDAGSTSTSREHSPFTQFSEEESIVLPQPVEDKDEGTRLTLEKLKQQITPSNMAAITPLKKTPPHFTEELANLSPAKPSKDTSLFKRDLTVAGLTSQSSLGFHPQYPPQNLTYGGGASQDSGSSSLGSSEESGGEEEVPRPHIVTTSTVAQHSTNQPLASTSRLHFAAPHQQDLTQPARKKKRKSKSQESGTTKKQKRSSSTEVRKSLVVTSAAPLVVAPQVPASLLVSIPLTDVKIGKPKVVATVGPYNVRSTTSHPRRNTLDSLADGDDSQSRDRYSRLGLQGDDYGTTLLPLHDYHSRSERSRGHSGAARWEREPSSWDHRTYGVPSRSGGRGEYGGRGHGHGWERDSHYRGNNEDYFSDGSHYDSAPQRGLGRTHARKMDPEYFMQEARRRKKEADKIMVPGLEKARLYMESVTYFMRHGGAIEYEQQAAAGHNQTVKRNPYKMYSDTLSMIKYCQHMAGECKPLLVLCLRCQSALYWRMYLIKQPSIAPLQKELQEFFLPPKASQSKSPFPGGLSPLPSPASVGSTASTSSAGAASCSHSSTHGDSTTITMPRHIFNKAAEHMTVSLLINTCLELWRLSESYMEQCKEFFLNADRKANLTVHYYSPVFQVASWVEDILKCF